jgi:23S rRNA (cytidine1920-2'-O)/16S rRNA (cytidine1409-2'-O)-methyltransferase
MLDLSMKIRLDQSMVRKGLVATRSQAESYIKLGQVTVNGRNITKPGFAVNESDEIKLVAEEQYVSRAGLKLASVAEALKLDFQDKIVLDVGSSTGGFTDYALQHGARKVIAVDVGTEQLHPSLRADDRVELHEKTDIRKFRTNENIDIVVIDVSFVSLREILPAVAGLCTAQTRIAAMVKPQFEAGQSSLKHKGVVKNDRMRRDILKDFESWINNTFIIIAKADSRISGSKGNQERFYLLQKT